MASQVPYTGAPELTPRFEPTPSVGVSATPAAFGVNIDEAVGHLGQVTEGAGKELFDRAYAMQELQVHADVNARLADAQNQMTNAYVDYTNLEGKNAVDGLTGYQQNLDKIRTDGGAGLSPIGQEFYDQESRQSRFRMSFAGAVHAKTEQKNYIVGSATAAAKSDMKAMELDPENTAANAAVLDRIRGVYNHIADIKGMSDDQRKALVDGAVSEAVGGQIRGMARSDPKGAQKLLNQALADKTIFGEDATKLSDYVKGRMYEVGSRTIAANAVNGDTGRMQFSVGVRNYNPTNIAYGQWAIKHGSTGGEGEDSGHKVAVFPDYKAGLEAAGDLALSKYAHGATSADTLIAGAGGWTPDNHEAAANVARSMGLKPGDDLRLNDPQQMQAFLHALVKQEVGPEGHDYVYNKGVNRMPLAKLDAATQVHAQADMPDDPIFAERVRDQTEIMYNKELRIQKDTEWHNNQTVAGAMYQGDQQGRLPTTVDELTAKPEVKEAWDQLDNTQKNIYIRELAHTAKGDVAWNPKREADWQTLSGMATNDPTQFMDKTGDLSSLDLPHDAKMKIISLRDAIYKKQMADPKIKYALGVLSGELKAAGLVKGQDEDNLNLVTGILADQITQFQQENDRPPKYDEIKEMGARLLQRVGAGYISSGTPWFETITSVPPEIQDVIRNDPKWRELGIPPTDQMVLQAYIGAQYQAQYGKKPKVPSK